jgi:hypothetical protein
VDETTVLGDFVLQAGNEFRMQIIDARKPNEIHKELVFTGDSKLIRQIRADFTFPQMLISKAP